MSKKHKSVKKISKAKNAYFQNTFIALNTQESFNQQKGKKASLKKKKMSSKVSSVPCSSSSSHSSKTGYSNTQVEENTMKSPTVSSKVQCDLCKLSYSTEKDLTEHLLSLMHHTKLEDKETNPVHSCTLCKEEFSSMAKYREHIGTSQHKKNLNKLRGLEEQGKEEKKKKDKRQGNWRGGNRSSGNFHQPNKWNNYEDEWYPPAENIHWNTYNYRRPNSVPFNYRKKHNFANERGISNEENDSYYDIYNPGQPGSMRHRDSYTDWERGQLRWGSGALSYNQLPAYQSYYGYGGHNPDFDYTQDSYDSNCDELWLQQRERLLADMDADDFEKPHSSRDIGRSSNENYDFSHCSSPKHHWQKFKQFDSSNKDRKRQREEDAPESFPKTLKHFGAKIDANETSGKGIVSYSNNSVKQPRKKDESEETFKEDSQTFDNLKSCKTALDSTSDNLLERAERLCKELREKRNSSHAWRSHFMRTKNHQNLNDKINTVAKKQQSYFKGHIKDSTSISQNDQSLLIAKQSNEHPIFDYSKSQPVNQFQAHAGLIIRKSFDKPETSLEKAKSVDLCKDAEAASLKQPQKLVSRTDQRKRLSREEDKEVNLSPQVEVSGMNQRFASRQALSKDRLMKMVNSPKSRTERVQLARMLQTRDSKSNPSMSTRTNINLEGLYDSQMNQDIQLDLGQGSDTTVIKLEDLSENVRNQIMSIIGGDISKDDVSFDSSPEIIPAFRKGDFSNLKDICDHNHSLKGDKSTGKVKSDRKRSVSSSRLGVASDQADGQTNKDSHTSSCKGNVEELNRNSYQEKLSDARIPQPQGRSHREQLENREIIDVDDITSRPNTDGDTSLTLNRENIMNKFPTIMDTMSSKEQVFQKGIMSHVDSGISSCSSGDVTKGNTIISFPLDGANERITPILESTKPQDESRSQDDGMNSESRIQVDDEGAIFSSQNHDNSSSQTMSKLLSLSEREEEVKQEMSTMELRLTRLHRLLEQAVTQINRCTERRNQLHEEEKNLTSQRMSLLRAVSSQQSSKASSVDMHSTSLQKIKSLGLETTLDQQKKSGSSQKRPEFSQENMPDSEAGPKSSLTKSEWLAKFSAYLPSDQSLSTNTTSHSTITSIASQTPSAVHSPTVTTCPIVSAASRDIPLSTDSVQSTMHQNLSKQSAVKDNGSNVVRALNSVATPLCENYSLTKSHSSLPSTMVASGLQGERTPKSKLTFPSTYIYMGQLNSDVLEKDTLSSCIFTQKENSTLASQKESHDIRQILSNRSEHNKMQEEISEDIITIRPPAPKKPESLTTLITSPRNDDSDINSVTSLASGSSLGEKISHLCKLTPGASLDVPGKHNLSVILSGPSDSNDVRGAEDQESNDSVDTKKVSLYGRLSKEAVKSAETLHLIERNSDGLTVMPDSPKDVKKKKRKTKHERNTGVTHRRRRYILSSSSEEDGKVNDILQSNDVSAIDLKQRRSLGSTCEDSSSDVIEIKPNSNHGFQRNNIINNPKLSTPEITIAECDSSTNLGVIDSASINAHSSKLKEMKDSFIHTFGRAPKCKVPNSDMDAPVEMKDTNDKAKGNKNNDIFISSDSDEKEIVNLCSDSDDRKSYEVGRQRYMSSASMRRRSLTLKSASLAQQSKFPSTNGSVCHLSVIKNKLYVGYLEFGLQVFDLAKEENLKDNEMHLLGLRCMETFEGEDEQVTILIGQGCEVCSILIKTKGLTSVDLGTQVTCIHTLGQSLYVGLDTGEICVLDRKLKKLHRYICSDCPIYCMASGGQEGTMRLLCVASLDSTITVMDSERCLPIRILLGHTKTAFSLQVHDRFVYSGSGDSTVMVHNLHTAAVEKIYRDNKGIVNCVCYSDGFLFTGGMDSLVRCYNVKTHKLIQVYYGAGVGAVKSICVHGKMLITGNTSGSVDIMPIDLKAKNVCPKKGCRLNFGNNSHLLWHLQDEHQEKSTT